MHENHLKGVPTPLVDVGYSIYELEDDAAIAHGLACFASWVSGKGFSRAMMLHVNRHPNRHERRKFRKLMRAKRG